MDVLNNFNMCLYTDQRKPLIADKPIKVYKIVKKIKTDDGNFEYLSLLKYTTPVRYNPGSCARMPELMHTDENLIREFNEAQISNLIYLDIPYKVNRGLFTFDAEADEWKSTAQYFLKLSTVQYLLKSNKKVFDIAVLECEIPVGAKYYKGFTYCYCKESAYVSDTLKIIREISF